MKKALKILFTLFVALPFVCSAVHVYAQDDETDEAYDALYVGGVIVTAENASDVLGDGTVSYDAASNTLILNGADINAGYRFAEPELAAVFCQGDLNIRVDGDSKINAPTAEEGSRGIYVKGNLNISGEHSLTVTTDDASSDLNETPDHADVDCMRIDVRGKLTVNKTHIEARGGKVILLNGKDDMTEFIVSRVRLC